MLEQVDLALINTNYALEAGLNPTKDALVIEGSESPYVNILVARADNQDAPPMQKLAKALHSDAVKAVHRREVRGRRGAGVLNLPAGNPKPALRGLRCLGLALARLRGDAGSGRSSG